MNFQIVPAAGLIPQAAVPIYGASASSQLLGQVVGAGGLLGPRPGQLPLLAAQGGGIAATSPASQAALLQGIRQPLGQPTVAGGQAMLAGVPAAGARLIVPPSSQAMYMMHSLSGGAAAGAVIPGIDPASLMPSGDGTSTDDNVLKSSISSHQPDGKCQSQLTIGCNCNWQMIEQPAIMYMLMHRDPKKPAPLTLSYNAIISQYSFNKFDEMFEEVI